MTQKAENKENDQNQVTISKFANSKAFFSQAVTKTKAYTAHLAAKNESFNSAVNNFKSSINKIK